MSNRPGSKERTETIAKETAPTEAIKEMAMISNRYRANVDGNKAVVPESVPRERAGGEQGQAHHQAKH